MRRTRHVAAFFLLAALNTFRAAGAGERRAVAFVHADVVTMADERVLRDHTVVVRDGRIAALGPSATEAVPEDALTVDAAGRFLSPGLADMHVHLYAPQELTLYAVHGVTTVLNLNGRPAHLAWRKRVAAGELLGPAIYSAGPTFNRPLGPEEAVAEVDRQAAAGYDAVKIYNQVGTAEYPALTAEARKKGLVLIGHIPREPGLSGTLDAGQSIAHAEEYVYTFFNDDPDPANVTVHPLDTMKIPRAVAMTRKAGVSVVPTLVAFHNIVRQATGVEAYLRNPDLAYLPPFIRAQLEPARNTYANRWPKERLPGLAVSYEFQRQLVKALHDGGVPVLAGTDASWLGVPGPSLVEEVENFQGLGFTPYEALRTATREPATFLGREKEFGTIAVGKRADMLLLAGNPLEDVRNLRRLEGVMAGGRWIPDSRRRRLLESLPGNYRGSLTRLAKLAETDPAALEAELAADDPLGSVSAAVWQKVAATRGPKKVVEALGQLHRASPGSPLVAEEAVNELGYSLAGSKQTDAAIEIFRLNTELYPKSGNTWDSLGETYLAAGNRELARRCYEKAVAVQPDYPNAKGAREILVTTLAPETKPPR